MSGYDQIFLVDDHDMTNVMHKIFFKKLGLDSKITTFTNPEVALNQLRTFKKEKIDLLMFLDLNMPEMSGFELLEILRKENFPTTFQVIIVTSSISPLDRAKSEKYHEFVKGFVTKPMRPDTLKEITGNLLRTG
ncbi:response regulator [Maribacter sp. 2210JD10-5]|uniref:response regulator n=1 Tax=Maribacter sp. 2210JD10-5 TaxID=3386272 RepID=UPI0039BD5C1B